MSQLTPEEQMRQDVRDIKKALLGDTEYKTPGLMHRVYMLEKWRANMTVKVAGVTGGAAVIMWLINRYVEKL